MAISKCKDCGKFHHAGACPGTPRPAGGSLSEKGFRYRPRGDFVIYRVRDRGVSAGGVALPDIAVEGKERVVVAMGPKVEDLAVGDVVVTTGQIGVDVSYLPDEKDLLITREANIAYVIEKELPA